MSLDEFLAKEFGENKDIVEKVLQECQRNALHRMVEESLLKEDCDFFDYGILDDLLEFSPETYSKVAEKGIKTNKIDFWHTLPQLEPINPKLFLNFASEILDKGKYIRDLLTDDFFEALKNHPIEYHNLMDDIFKEGYEKIKQTIEDIQIARSTLSEREIIDKLLSGEEFHTIDASTSDNSINKKELVYKFSFDGFNSISESLKKYSDIYPFEFAQSISKIFDGNTNAERSMLQYFAKSELNLGIDFIDSIDKFLNLPDKDDVNLGISLLNNFYNRNPEVFESVLDIVLEDEKYNGAAGLTSLVNTVAEHIPEKFESLFIKIMDDLDGYFTRIFDIGLCALAPINPDLFSRYFRDLHKDVCSEWDLISNFENYNALIHNFAAFCPDDYCNLLGDKLLYTDLDNIDDNIKIDDIWSKIMCDDRDRYKFFIGRNPFLNALPIFAERNPDKFKNFLLEINDYNFSSKELKKIKTIDLSCVNDVIFDVLNENLKREHISFLDRFSFNNKQLLILAEKELDKENYDSQIFLKILKENPIKNYDNLIDRILEKDDFHVITSVYNDLCVLNGHLEGKSYKLAKKIFFSSDTQSLIKHSSSIRSFKEIPFKDYIDILLKHDIVEEFVKNGIDTPEVYDENYNPIPKLEEKTIDGVAIFETIRIKDAKEAAKFIASNPIHKKYLENNTPFYWWINNPKFYLALVEENLKLFQDPCITEEEMKTIFKENISLYSEVIRRTGSFYDINNDTILEKKCYRQHYNELELKEIMELVDESSPEKIEEEKSSWSLFKSLKLCTDENKKNNLYQILMKELKDEKVSIDEIFLNEHIKIFQTYFNSKYSKENGKLKDIGLIIEEFASIYSKSSEQVEKIDFIMSKGLAKDWDEIIGCSDIEMNNNTIMVKRINSGAWGEVYQALDSGISSVIKISKSAKESFFKETPRISKIIRHFMNISPYKQSEEALIDDLSEKDISNALENMLKTELTNSARLEGHGRISKYTTVDEHGYFPIANVSPNLIEVKVKGEKKFALRYKQLAGISLQEFIMNHPNDKTLLEVLAKTAYSLSYIHQNGLCHNDVHTDNFIVDISDENNVYALDFAFSKSNFYCGSLVGKMTHVAPEHIKGTEYSDEKPGEKADQFAFGSIMYLSLMGAESRPYDLAETREEYINRVSSGNIQPDFKKLEKSVDSELYSIVARCLDFNPDKRFDTMRDVENALVDYWRGVQ